jgi:hypothetical protein
MEETKENLMRTKKENLAMG